MLHLKALEKKLDFEVIIHPHTPRLIYTDEGKLRQILINLVGNAIKFTDLGHVYVRVFVQNNLHIYFEVEDTGSGISDSEMATLFQPFVQTDSGRRSQEGTGLGLSISYNYVHLMGGEMSVTSTVGKGSTFSFYIPLKPLESNKSESIRSSNRVVGLQSNQTNYRILIAEDIRLNRQLLTRILSPLGFEVREVNNGIEAIAVWQSWSPHLIWMDARMPMLNGSEAASAIRAIEAERNIPYAERVKMIALTASLVNSEEEDLSTYGFDGFVTKPFTEDLVFEEMARHLNLQYIYLYDS
jgi:CheY-like chemotaxis protein